jgi:acyl-CoA thioesterase FadM
LTVWARCVGVRGARFRYEYRITRGEELIADGHTNHAVVRRDTYRPTRMPDWLSEAISSAESASSSTAS